MAASRSVRWIESRLASSRTAGDAWLEHRGTSMAPSLWPGDRLRITPLGGAAPAVGEIVVARRGAVLVAHRVVARRGPLAVTRGDGSPTTDPPILVDQLLGRVVEVERAGRRSAPPRGAGLLARTVRWLSARR